MAPTVEAFDELLRPYEARPLGISREEAAKQNVARTSVKSLTGWKG